MIHLIGKLVLASVASHCNRLNWDCCCHCVQQFWVILSLSTCLASIFVSTEKWFPFMRSHFIQFFFLLFVAAAALVIISRFRNYFIRSVLFFAVAIFCFYFLSIEMLRDLILKRMCNIFASTLSCFVLFEFNVLMPVWDESRRDLNTK